MTITKRTNLFIGGVQKSGTTSLHYFLSKHPDIFIPEVLEEIHFFDIDENYYKGIDWYMDFFSQWQKETYVAQTSPLYIYQPEVSKRIQKFNPEAKFIFILRNPIDRAYSHYWNSVRYGYENLSFEEALNHEKARINRNFDFRRHYSYIDRGKYKGQILKYYELFPRENILILLFDQLKNSYVDIGNMCGDFLDIDPNKFVLNEEQQTAKNTAQVPKFAFLQRLISKQYERKSRHEIFKIPLMARLIEKVNNKDIKYTPMKEETRLKLVSELRSEIIGLQDLLKIDLKHWLNL